MTDISASEFLERHAPFDRLEPEARQFIAEHVQMLHFPPGQRVAGPDSGRPEYLYIIVRGAVHVEESAESGGAHWTLSEGECFPVGALSGERPTTNVYLALDEVACYGLPAKHFAALVDLSKTFSRYCSNYLSNLLKESRRHLQTRVTQFAAEQQSLAAELSQLVKRAPISVPADATLWHALELMDQQKIGSIAVVDAAGIPVGIFTKSDVLKRVVLAKAQPTQAIASVMSPNPVALSETARIHDAIFAMAERGVRHVLVVDAAGCLTGVVSERDLFALQKIGVGYIHQAIESAPDVDGVAQSIQSIHQFAINMLTQGVGADQITRFISTLNDAATKRIIEINLPAHDLAGIEWSWLAFGSEGREEQTLCTDQDNGIVFQCSAEVDIPSTKARLIAFAQAVNADLDRCGYPLCEGNIMAGNPQWCLTLDQWRQRFTDWVLKPEPVALLHANIFFDFRAIYGRAALVDDLHRHLFGMSQSNTGFQRMLAANALQTAPPLGTFRDFVTETESGGEPYIDLKKSGARLFADAARVFALAEGIEAANTVQRLRHTAAAMGNSADGNEALIEAFNFIQLLRLRHQYAEIGQGRRGDNRFPPVRLNQLDRRILKEAFRQARRLQQRLTLNYQLAVM